MIRTPFSHLLRSCLIALVVTACSFASQAMAGTGIFGTYLFIDADGSATTYGLTDHPMASSPDFDGADLGTFDSGLMTLTLNGAEANTFKNGGSDVTAAELSFRVYESGGTPGSFNQVGLGFGANSTYLDAGGVTISGGGDQKWEELTAGVDLLDGLAPGTYDLEVFVKAFTSDGDRFHNDDGSGPGSNYIGSFTVSAVPEVSAALALPLLLGSVWGFHSMKRRRTAS